MTKDTKTRKIHDRLMVLQILNYRKRGYSDIKFIHTKNPQELPEPVNGYTPDLSAVINDKTVICDIEMNDSLYDQDTIKQWQAFGKSDYEFHLLVSKDSFNEVKEIAKANGIKVDKYWSISY